MAEKNFLDNVMVSWKFENKEKVKVVKFTREVDNIKNKQKELLSEEEIDKEIRFKETMRTIAETYIRNMQSMNLVIKKKNNNKIKGEVFRKFKTINKNFTKRQLDDLFNNYNRNNENPRLRIRKIRWHNRIHGYRNDNNGISYIPYFPAFAAGVRMGEDRLY